MLRSRSGLFIRSLAIESSEVESLHVLGVKGGMYFMDGFFGQNISWLLRDQLGEL
jgi:hypothetical protein